MLQKLVLLNLKSCPSLESIPKKIKGLKSLKILKNCSNLCKLPEDLEQLTGLKEMNVKKNGLEYLPPTIFHMGHLKMLYCQGIASTTIRNNIINGLLGQKHCFLPDDLSNSLIPLDLSNCNITDEALPGFFGAFVSLMKLNLNDNLFFVLPPNMNKLPKLRYLSLKNCKSLNSLGKDLPSTLKEVQVDNYSSLNSFLDPLNPCHLSCSAFLCGLFRVGEARQQKDSIFITENIPLCSSLHLSFFFSI